MVHRKNALFYRTMNGAEVGDLFMSLIHTCQLCGAKFAAAESGPEAADAGGSSARARRPSGVFASGAADLRQPSRRAVVDGCAGRSSLREEPASRLLLASSAAVLARLDAIA